MKYEKPDGVIEIGMSGCGHPPDKPRPHGQCTNSATQWWRVISPLGPPTEWHPLRQQSAVMGLARSSKTVANFLIDMLPYLEVVNETHRP